MVIIMIADEQANQAFIHHMMRTLVEHGRESGDEQGIMREAAHSLENFEKFDYLSLTQQAQMFSVRLPATSAEANFSKTPGAYANTQGEMGQYEGTIRPLTDREREILDLMRKGQKNREIATELAIAESTVHKHIQNIFEKLHARNRTEAIYLTSAH
jgi:DNA-binding NarL/FixJ family response regulator